MSQEFETQMMTVFERPFQRGARAVVYDVDGHPHAGVFTRPLDERTYEVLLDNGRRVALRVDHDGLPSNIDESPSYTELGLPLDFGERNRPSIAGLGFGPLEHSARAQEKAADVVEAVAQVQESLDRGNCESAYIDLATTWEWLGAARAERQGAGEFAPRIEGATDALLGVSMQFRKKCLRKK
jgi:hypothetical protein